MTDDRPLPLFATLTQESTREEVLAALAEIDEQDAQLVVPEVPAVPPRFRGCLPSTDDTRPRRPSAGRGSTPRSS